jgi:peptidoglycan/LPS O-acetylase OafA/YrhL
VRRRLADGSVKEYRYPAFSPQRHERYAPDSIAALVKAYQRSPEWAALAPASRSFYAIYIRDIEGMGAVRATDLKRREILEVRDAIRAARGMILGNLAIVPLYFQGPPWWTCTLIPQAWSLALELMFYLVVPLLAVRLWPVTALAAAYSFWVYGQAYLGIINTDWFGFRQLPGTLFIFIAGMAFARPGVGWIVYSWGVWVMSLVLWGVLLHVPHLYALGTNKEIVAGVAFGIPALAITRKLPSTPWDRLAGDLSYGVYLNHFLVVLLVQAGIGQAPSWPALLAVCAGSVGLSLSTFRTIELPILARRRAWRARRERASARAASEIARDPNLLDAES